MNPTKNKSVGFTLVEIMIVVAIIALLAAIALPNFLRARKRAQASSIMNDLRSIESAVDQYAIEFGKTSGETVSWAAVKGYLKKGTNLYNTGLNVLGVAYDSDFPVDTPLGTPAGTGAALGDVAPAAFWSPFVLVN